MCFFYYIENEVNVMLYDMMIVVDGSEQGRHSRTASKQGPSQVCDFSFARPLLAPLISYSQKN
jgi:hypothetical protein